ncbi:hypothetical protein NUSPORA_02450 [Nucleospora cyclopteri]
MEQTFKTIEESDGIRLTWNAFSPSTTRTEIVPIACLYNLHQPCNVLEYEPIICQKCQAIFCPFAVVDYGNFTWTCPFCGGRSHLPKDIDLENIPELNESTVEYVLSRNTAFPPVFVFIIDTCTYDEERHELMIKSVEQAFDALPADSMVGIVLYGTNINLYSFTDEHIKTIYQYSGEVAYEKSNIKGIEDIRQFLVKKEDRINDILKVISGLKKDPFPVPDGFRPNRCTGSAISFALSFMEGPFAENPVKYTVFTQGPCTYGPGRISPLEISSDEKINMSKSAEFYDALGQRMNDSGHSIDIIAATIADIGLDQMKALISETGGAIILAQDFEERIISKSIEMLYRSRETALEMEFNVKMQVKTSPNLTFKNFMGEGKARGSGWKVGCVLPNSNMTFLFEANEKSKPNSFAYVQLISQYQRSDRKIITKVTTFSRMFTSDRNQLAQSFDQEAACIAQSRIFCLQPYENIFDLETAIDKHLIRFTRRYGTWERNNQSSVVMPDTMSYYSNFMFFFRRSFVIQKDGISADESQYFKMLLFKLPTNDALKIIKPTLISFHYQGDIQPVELDIESLNDECMLVLDSFHNVLLWNGMNVEVWKKQNLQEQSEYKFFKESIQEAQNYAKSLLEDRMPAPQYKETSAGKSQERILLTHISSSTSNSLNTQKIDFNKFYVALCKHIVYND